MEMGESAGQRDVAGREDVRSFEGEQEVDLGGPGAETTDGADGGDGFVVTHRGDTGVVEPSVGIGGGEGAGMGDLGARQAGATQGVIVERKEAFRGKRARQDREAAPDRAGGLVADLLAHDGLQQASEAGGAAAPWQRASAGLDAGERAMRRGEVVEPGAGGGGRVGEFHAPASAANRNQLQRVLRKPTVLVYRAEMMSAAQGSAAVAPEAHLLVVDDDREIRDLLALFLEREGFRVTTARDAREARKLWQAGECQLVVLDLMLPGESGLEFARWLRGQSQVPIVMLTALGEEADRIAGLELGADDYLAKPFNPRELLARVRAVLRRSGERAGGHRSASIVFADWVLDTVRRRLINPEGTEVPLTGGEFELLSTMVERANRVLTRDMLLELLRGRQAGPFDRAIDVAISRLRRKLEDNGRNAQLIKTVRGGGYVLAAEVKRQ